MTFRKSRASLMRRFRAFAVLSAVLTLLSFSADGFAHAGDGNPDFGQDHTCVTCHIGHFVGAGGGGQIATIRPPSVVMVRNISVFERPLSTPTNPAHPSRAPPQSL